MKTGYLLYYESISAMISMMYYIIIWQYIHFMMLQEHKTITTFVMVAK